MPDQQELAEERLFIGGRFVQPLEGRTYPNINPATERQIGCAGDATPSDMEAAIAAARHAYDTTSWAREPEFRRTCIEQLYAELTKRQSGYRELFIDETGITYKLTHTRFFSGAVEAAAYWAAMASDYQYEQSLPDTDFGGVTSKRTIIREPVGVVGAIVPWNTPLQLALAKLLPALAAGNSVVLKPAPDTPWAGMFIAAAAAETDLPPGVLNVITSSENAVGDTLTGDSRVDLITFTGSTAIGRHVMARAAGTVKRVILELGGKSALVALGDADMDHVARVAASQVTTHAGQGCMLLTRLLLPRSRYAEGVEAVAEAMRAVRYGDPHDPDNTMGPLVNGRQYERVLGYIEQGRADGARLVLGGRRPAHLPEGYYVAPTLFADVAPDSTIAQEEIFGPVLCVIPYRDVDEAVAIANGTQYGLSSGVIGDPGQANTVARRLRAGSCSINGGVWFGVDAPFGGYSQSGNARENGVEGFEGYLETKVIGEPVP